MSATTPLEAAPARDRISPREAARWIGLYILVCLVTGVLAGLAWLQAVDLPGYYVLPDGRGTIDERGLAEVFGTDAWFVVLGLVLGPWLGWLAWRWLRPLGWRAALLAAAGAEVAALSAWAVATLVSPAPLRDRLADAHPGDLVPVDFALHAQSALAVWPFAALLPIMLLSSLLPDPDDAAAGPAARRSGRRWFALGRASVGGEPPAVSAADDAADEEQPDRDAGGRHPS